MMTRWKNLVLPAALAMALSPVARVQAADDPAGANVQLEAAGARPRTVEALTSQRILHDYRLAWKDLADAFNSGRPDLVNQYFVGPANAALANAVHHQNQAGIHSRYLSQNHRLEAVFYAPEGDVMELHDTVVCDLQLLDGANVIHDEHATLYYVVLMTPAADRWVIRQLQAVPRF